MLHRVGLSRKYVGIVSVRALSFPIGTPMRPHITKQRAPQPINIKLPPPLAPVVQRPFKRNSRRTGLIVRKAGLVNMYDKYGRWHLLSVLHVEDCHVVQILPQVAKESNLGYMHLQVGAGTKHLKSATLPEIGHCAKAGVGPKRKLTCFKITPDAIIPIGTQLSAMHFIPGQLVDIKSVSKGKGFAGVMKKYNFKGMPASHGVSKSHRGLGATGACQDPGKVWPGKKMPGRMGGNNVLQKKMKIVGIDPVKNLLYIKGTIPGNKGSYVEIRDSYFTHQPLKAPFPTHVPSENDPKEDLFIDLGTRNYYDPESQTIRPEKELAREGPEMPSLS